MTSAGESTFERRRRAIQVALWYLAISSAYVAVWILIAPKGFYDTFPTGGAHWVNKLPPYNEHLERDFGATGLGLALLAALAAVWMERRLVQATALVFLAASLPHLAYHLTTTEHYSTSDNVQSLLGLAAPVLVSVGLLAASRAPRAGAVAPPGASGAAQR
jgi:hypothetical protein